MNKREEITNQLNQLISLGEDLCIPSTKIVKVPNRSYLATSETIPQEVKFYGCDQQEAAKFITQGSQVLKEMYGQDNNYYQMFISVLNKQKIDIKDIQKCVGILKNCFKAD